MSPWTVATVTIVSAAALEGACAGRNVRQRLQVLRQPRSAPSFRVWLLIGAAFYAICFGIAFRLAARWPAGGAISLAGTLFVAFLGLNAFWNYALFRRGDLRLVWRVTITYALTALLLATSLFASDRLAGLFLLPYLAYLPYAMWLTREIRRLNAHQVRPGAS